VARSSCSSGPCRRYGRSGLQARPGHQAPPPRRAGLDHRVCPDLRPHRGR